jgi:hypothetical protein
MGYIIENRPPGQLTWSSESIGNPREFSTREEAERLIADIRELARIAFETQYRVIVKPGREVT